MNQFRVYLRSELGKLKNWDDALWFLRSIRPEVLEVCSLPNDKDRLVEAFSAQDQVDAFVQSLNGFQLKTLTQSCDIDWRKNGVFDNLSRHSSWLERSIPIGLVDVQQAEPRLAYIFERHNFRLMEIVSDPELWSQEPYADWNLNGSVQFLVCLGRLKSGRYKLFDGIHRAILLCRQGARNLEICSYEA